MDRETRDMLLDTADRFFTERCGKDIVNSVEKGVWPAGFRASEPVTALKLTREGLEQCLVGNSDPRGLLETLREQHNDRDVAGTVRRLRTGT